jgi:hypothetical protein
MSAEKWVRPGRVFSGLSREAVLNFADFEELQVWRDAAGVVRAKIREIRRADGV